MLAVVLVIAIQPLVTSQTNRTLEPAFSQAIVAVRNAQSAGATPGEVAGLIVLLNKALDLNREALKLNTTDESQERALLSQVDQTLAMVESRAADLTIVSSQRSYDNLILAYVGGAIAATLGTLLYVLTVHVYRKHQIRRTFQMGVTPK
jgi:hypothetical protein